MSQKLKVEILSFAQAYDDHHGQLNGPPNFMFDCRGLTNPGRLDEYKPLTGKDQPVIDFLESETSALEFGKHVEEVIIPGVKSALERNLGIYKIWFGCTGGQHRSVYFADKIAALLSNWEGLEIEVKHLDVKSRYWAKKLASKTE